MKLLVKPANVATPIFDWVGIRFVTRYRFDCLLVAKYLRMHDVVAFPNVWPGRSRNTLIDVPRVRAEIAALAKSSSAGQLSEGERVEVLRRVVASWPVPTLPDDMRNPLSDVTYNSIHFTCRHSIRVQSPHATSLLAELSQRGARLGLPPDLLADVCDYAVRSAEIRFQFPFEVQILDIEAYERSRSGLASHDEYKERQRQQVKHRLCRHLPA